MGVGVRGSLRAQRSTATLSRRLAACAERDVDVVGAGGWVYDNMGRLVIADGLGRLFCRRRQAFWLDRTPVVVGGEEGAEKLVVVNETRSGPDDCNNCNNSHPSAADHQPAEEGEGQGSGVWNGAGEGAERTADELATGLVTVLNALLSPRRGGAAEGDADEDSELLV